MKKENEHGPTGRPSVEVVYLNTNEERRFHAHWNDTVAQVWNQAYHELGEARREQDQIECQDGHSLMPHLNLTLAELRDQHLCQDRRFQIKSETGGAAVEGIDGPDRR